MLQIYKRFRHMQEEKQIISPIKQRILFFAATLGISKREFYTKIGVSRGTLESKTGITEDILAKFIATYPNVSPAWLLMGEEPMLKQNVSNEKSTGNTLVTSDKDTINKHTNQEEISYMYKMYQDEKADWKEEKKELKVQIDQLQSELRQQSAELAALKAKYHESQDIEPEPIIGLTDSFTDKSSGDYGEGFMPTKKSPSKKSLAGKAL